MPVTLSNVSATAGDQSIVFTWQISGTPTAGSYQFRYNLAGDSTALTVDVPATDSSISYSADIYSYSLTGLTNGTAYNASFRVYSSATPSVFSVIANSPVFTVTPAPIVIPGTPSNVTFEAGDEQLTIRWSAAESAAEYIIYNRGNMPYENLTINHSTQTAIHTNLVNGSPYEYKIGAISAAGMIGQFTAIAYGMPVNPENIASTVSAYILQGQANGDSEGAIWAINTLINSLTTPEQKNTAAGAAAQAVVTGRISSNPSADTGSKIANISTELANITTNLSVAQVSTIAQQIVSSITESNDLDIAEKIAILARTINTVGNTSSEMKTAFVEQLSAQGTFTGAPIPLNQTQTAALFASRSNIVNPPSTVKVSVPTGNTVMLSDTEPLYILMKPSVNYNFTHGGSSVSLMYNPSTQRLVGNGIDSTPGDILTVGTWNGRIFAAGSAGVAPVTVPGAPTNVSATAGNASASVSWTAPSSDGGSALTGYTVISNPAGGVTAPISGSTTSTTVTGLTNGTSYTFTVTATNEVGTGSASSASNLVTPSAGGGGGGGGGVPCFPAGVRIRTPHGEKPVESLRTGDLILTATGHAVPIRMRSYEIACTTKTNAPYFIPAGALGPKAPAKPLHLSPLHAFQIRPNVWWNAQEAAKASDKLEQYGLGEPLTYYHVECPNFLRDNLVADGVVVESFAANQLTPAQKHHLYTYSKKLGGFVRNGRAVM